MEGFILVCNECNQRIVLENKMDFNDLSKKFHIIVSDMKEIMIICNQCGNKIKI